MRMKNVRTRGRGVSIAAACCLLAHSWVFAAQAATTIHTDANNAAGPEDGTALHPFATIQAALDAAASGDPVKVAHGVYAENIIINARRIELRGGYAGGSSAGYAGAASGDFSVQAPLANLTHIQGANPTATVLLQFTPSLTPPVPWTDVQVVPSVVDGLFTVTRTASDRTWFYRLRGWR